MRPFTPELYRDLLAKSHDPILNRQMQDELELISSIPNVSEKTFIDLGAGYGRITRYLAEIAHKVVSIEINPIMFSKLECISRNINNCEVINGDFTKLSQLISSYTIQKPVFLVLQNTIGTIEGENFSDFLSELKACCQKFNGEIILTIFRQEKLREWGVRFYKSISKMTGPIDMNNTNFERGLFFSHTGYFSKWRSKEEIQKIIEVLGCSVIHEVSTNEYCVIYLAYL